MGLTSPPVHDRVAVSHPSATAAPLVARRPQAMAITMRQSSPTMVLLRTMPQTTRHARISTTQPRFCRSRTRPSRSCQRRYRTTIRLARRTHTTTWMSGEEAAGGGWGGGAAEAPAPAHHSLRRGKIVAPINRWSRSTADVGAKAPCWMAVCRLRRRRTLGAIGKAASAAVPLRVGRRSRGRVSRKSGTRSGTRESRVTPRFGAP